MSFLCVLTSKCASCHNILYTLFQHLNFQKFSEPASRRNGVHFFGHFNLKCSEAEVFVHLDFEMCFAPERRAIFSSLIWPDGSARRFSEPTLRPSGATNHWKNTVARDFTTFSARLHLLSSDSFSSLIFSLLLFSSILFSDSSHLCFAICPYCRKFDF